MTWFIVKKIYIPYQGYQSLQHPDNADIKNKHWELKVDYRYVSLQFF